MSRTFYVDSRTGSDANSGSANAPWASLQAVNGAGLQAGDTVLFARGATFEGGIDIQASGLAGAPITFGAYGTGADPVITGGDNGFDGHGNSHIVIRDVHITNMSGAGIISWGGSHWTIDNVDVNHVGTGYDVRGDNQFSAFHFRFFSDLTIQNSHYDNVTGDGVFLWEVDGLKILNNDFQVPQGPYADNVHTYRISNYEIRGNVMSFDGPTDSGKGNMIVQESKDGVIADNTFIMTNAHYGIGGTIQNGVIENNHFIGRKEGEWSVGLNVTETLGAPSDVSDMTIRDNFFDGSGIGIYTWDGNNAGTAHRDNFQITGNVFKDLRDPAVVAEWPVRLDGAFADNTLINTADPNFGGNEGAWTVTDNAHSDVMPAWIGGAEAFRTAVSASAATVENVPAVTAEEVFAPLGSKPATPVAVPPPVPALSAYVEPDYASFHA
jgi:polysaccharidase protein